MVKEKEKTWKNSVKYSNCTFIALTSMCYFTFKDMNACVKMQTKCALLYKVHAC